MQEESPSSDLIGLTAEIVCVYMEHNQLNAGDLSKLITDVHAALEGLQHKASPAPAPAPELAKETKLKPAVPVRKSVTPDYIICLEDGKKFKSLKRHLRLHGMSPDEYREKWGLSADYPMVAATYSAKRSALAKKNGLGTRR